MSFFQKNNIETKNNDFQTTFLQTYQKNHKQDKRLSQKNNNYSVKRMSLFFPSKKASITIETSLILPLFLFVIINLLSILNIIRLYSNVEIILHQTGKEMAVHAYAVDKAIDDNNSILNTVLSIGYSAHLKEQIIEGLNKDYLNASPLVNGEKGISFVQSSVLNDDIIDLVAEYKVKPAISLFGFGQIGFINRCRMRAWTGYDNTKTSEFIENSDDIVYVAENGMVYHTRRSCTHLLLSINKVSSEEIYKLRNENGGKYYLCELCGNYKNNIVYITKQGNRYHTNSDCSGLKRTIYTISIQDVGERTKCQRCG